MIAIEAHNPFVFSKSNFLVTYVFSICTALSLGIAAKFLNFTGNITHINRESLHFPWIAHDSFEREREARIISEPIAHRNLNNIQRTDDKPLAIFKDDSDVLTCPTRQTTHSAEMSTLARNIVPKFVDTTLYQSCLAGDIRLNTALVDSELETKNLITFKNDIRPLTLLPAEDKGSEVHSTPARYH
jgi:hypothetical protein